MPPSVIDVLTPWVVAIGYYIAHVSRRLRPHLHNQITFSFTCIFRGRTVHNIIIIMLICVFLYAQAAGKADVRRLLQPLMLRSTRSKVAHYKHVGYRMWRAA